MTEQDRSALVDAVVHELDPRVDDTKRWYHEHERQIARGKVAAWVESVLESKAVADYLFATDRPNAHGKAVEQVRAALASALPPQSPTREQIAEAIYTMRAGSKQNWHKAAFRDDYLKEADAVLALFPQPAPSAEPGLREMVQALRDEMFTELDSPDHLVPLDSLVERMDALLADNVLPADPPSIADMAPGTTFTEEVHWEVTTGAIRGEQFAIATQGGGRRGRVLSEFDPSTIRDVREPRQ